MPRSLQPSLNTMPRLRSRIRRMGVILLLPSLAAAQELTVQDILKLPVPPADHRIFYGRDASQFGDLRLPKGPGEHPVAVVIHGGCWLAEYNLDHISSFCAALTRAGIATWSLEYRRVGDPGGGSSCTAMVQGWPGTFEDVSRGTDHLKAIAGKYHLDVNRVVVVGHSAGGHLALWLAARHRLPKGSLLFTPRGLPLRGVVSLAGIADLREAYDRKTCGDAVDRLLGGSPAEVAERYAQTSPLELLPLGVPQRLIHGARDRIVPLASARAYEAAAKKSGDDVRLTVLDSAGHFELIAPQSSAWATVQDTILSLLGPRSGEFHGQP